MDHHVMPAIFFKFFFSLNSLPLIRERMNVASPNWGHIPKRIWIWCTHIVDKCFIPRCTMFYAPMYKSEHA